MYTFDAYPRQAQRLPRFQQLKTDRIMLYENGSRKRLYSSSPQDNIPESKKVFRTLVSHLDRTDEHGKRTGLPPFSERGFTARFLPPTNDAVYTINCQPHTYLEQLAYTSTSASRQHALLSDGDRLLLAEEPTFVALAEASLELMHLIEHIQQSPATPTFENPPFSESFGNAQSSSPSRRIGRVAQIWQRFTSTPDSPTTLR